MIGDSFTTNSVMLIVFGVSFLLFAVAAKPGGEGSITNHDRSIQLMFEAIKVDDVASFNEMATQRFQGKLSSLQNATGWTALHVAAFYGAEKISEYLLVEAGVNLNDRNLLGETPLHLASLNNHVRIVEQLITKAKDRKFNMSIILEANQIEGRTPIFYAAKASLEVVSVLLNEKINLFHVDIYGMQPIHYAIASRNMLTTNAILMKLPSADAAMQQGQCQHFGKTISHLAAEYNFVQFAEGAVDQFNFNSVDALGQNPACWAAINGSIELAKFMLGNSKDILNGSCVYGKNNDITGTPLHAAAYYRRKEYVELLLNSGANKTARDSSGGTVVHAMARQSNSKTERDAEDVKEIMLLFRARHMIMAFQARDNLGRTPFLLAVESSALIFARILQENSITVDPETVDKDGYSAIHLVSNLDFLKYLLSLPRLFSNIEVRTTSKSLTVLLAAVKRRAPIQVISYLLGLGADKQAVNNLGQNAIHLAVEENQPDTLELLEILFSYSFNFSARDSQGRTPLMYTIELDRVDAAVKIIELLPDALTDKTVDAHDSPLHLAVMKTSTAELVRKIVSSPQFDASAKNSNNKTALHIAVAYLHIEAVNVLLEHGASSSLSVVDEYERTPLHWAANWCNSVAVDIAKLLLAYIPASSALLQSVDYKNDSPLDLAIKHNCLEMVDVILGSSVALDSENCQKPNKQGLTPWQLAKSLGNDVMAENMVKKGLCSKQALPKDFKAREYKPVDCEDLHQRYPDLTSGVYTIYPSIRSAVVYCDMTYFGGGWTVFQRQIDGSQNFTLNWADYKKGFGDLSANFWLGNDNIHAITSGKYEYNLLIALTANDSSTGYALYDGFRIDNEANFYTLRFRSFKVNGNNIGDSLTYHKDMKFTTIDSDNDTWPDNCANAFRGAWWYGACHHSNLNGVHGNAEHGKGLNWVTWRGGHYESMKTTAMMIRRSSLYKAFENLL